MAEFSAAVYQNEFLPDGGTDVNAIVTVTCTGAGAAGQSGSGDAGEIIIVDTSGSMGGDQAGGGQAAAAAAAIDQILDGTWFAVVAGHPPGLPGLPAATPAPAWSGWTPATRSPQRQAIASSAPTAAPRWAPG